MSLILDALRKMEQERKSRLGTDGVDIRPEVLRYRGAAPPPARRPYYLQGGIALLLVVAGIGAGVFFRGGKGAPTPETVVAAAPRPVPTEQPPAAAPAAPQPAPQPIPVPATAAAPLQPAAPVAVVPPAPPRPAAPSAAPVTVPSSAPRQAGGVAAGARPARSARVADEPQAAQSSAVEDARAPSDITVSGIAWQEERALRRAVVNGALVGEGTEVAGARVLEIRESRVRFSRGGHTFDVSYSSN